MVSYGKYFYTATTDDPLNPHRGVWGLNTWLYKSYATNGAPNKITTSMVKAGHDYNQEQREITYSWMRRWIGQESADFWEEDTPLEKVRFMGYLRRQCFQ